MSIKVKIVGSPFVPNLEVVEDIVIKLHFPYNDKEVTVQINPNIVDYKEKDDKPGIQVRQVSVSRNTDETQTLKFDFKGNKTKDVVIAGKTYKIELLNIGKENREGQNFPYFEFSVDVT